MAKASRTAEATNGEQPKSGKVFCGVDGNGEFYCHDGKGNRVPFDPNEPVRLRTTLTPETLERLRQMPMKTPSGSDLARSDFRDKLDQQHEAQRRQREAEQQQQFQETLGALADAIASRVDAGAKGKRGSVDDGAGSTPANTTNAKTLRPSATKQNKLCELDEYVLLALGELKAFDKDNRRTAEQIANHLDPKNDRYYVKKPLAKLKQLKLADSHQGPKGGSWLTAKGKRRFEMANAKR